MFRVIVIIFAFAAYGAYSLWSSVTTSAPTRPSTSQTASVANSFLGKASFAGAADLAASTAANMVGLDLKPIPESGCSASILSPAQVVDLVDQLPEGQRAVLAKMLDTTSGMWSAQLYTGDSGVGLCLPKQGKVLKMPGVSAPDWASADGVVGAVRSLTESVGAAH